jgi:hypothetical protein
MARPKKDGAAITQAEAVRQAVEAGKTMPQDGVAYIKEKFGIAMKPQVFSTNKSILKKRTNGSTSTRGASRGGLTIRIDDVVAVKELVRQHGAAGVKKLVDVVS